MGRKIVPEETRAGKKKEKNGQRKRGMVSRRPCKRNCWEYLEGEIGRLPKPEDTAWHVTEARGIYLGKGTPKSKRKGQFGEIVKKPNKKSRLIKMDRIRWGRTGE